MIALVHAKYAITGLHGIVLKSIVLVVTKKVVGVIPLHKVL